MKEYELKTFEAGFRGKPDELDYTLAMIAGACFLDADPMARFNIRAIGSILMGPNIGFYGEASGNFDIKTVEDRVSREARRFYQKLHGGGSTDLRVGFDVKSQSKKLSSNDLAGDSGAPIAVAFANTPMNLPWERYLAVGIRNLVDGIYLNGGKVPEELANESGVEKIVDLLPDGKVEVGVKYDPRQNLQQLSNIIIARQHSRFLPVGTLREQLEPIVRAYLGKLAREYNTGALTSPAGIIINGLGDWNVGGWRVDAGSAEAKPHRDGFGDWGVGEDSFAGEDPSKPSGTGTYLARYLANHLVRSGLAPAVRVKLQYVIGEAQPREFNVTSFRTSEHSQADLEQAAKGLVDGDLSIAAAVERFNLRDPALFRRIANSADFFHDPELPWER